MNNKKDCPGWQETFDSAMDITALISPDFDILKINKAGCNSLGRKAEEIVGKKCYQVVHGLDHPISGCACKRTKETGLATESEIFDRGRYYLTTAAPIKDNQNNFVAFAHTVKDITDIKHAERALIEAKEELEEKVKGRTEALRKANEKLNREINARKKSEIELIRANEELDKQRVELEKKNSALSEIIAQIEIEKNKIKNNIGTNIERIILPLVDRLNSQDNANIFINLIKQHLEDISTQYGSSITKSLYKLSPREIELCNYIKGGLSTKEIAKHLNLSTKTINKHRRNIRVKLQLTNSNTNLTTYLSKIAT